MRYISPPPDIPHANVDRGTRKREDSGSGGHSEVELKVLTPWEDGVAWWPPLWPVLRWLKLQVNLQYQWAALLGPN